MPVNTKDITIEQNMSLNKMLDKNNSIEIPIIQRDYAQGRENAKELRTDFLKDIFTHLCSEQSIKLSFVYGTSNGNIYVPYDGQQRLTLVYLLTLFLAAYCEDWDCIKNLTRFNYYTRDHATAFCQFLTRFDTDFPEGKKNVFQRITIQDKKNISERLKNDSLFFGSWIYEPTVSSMIVVLQSIQDEFMNATEKMSHEERILKAKAFLKQIKEGQIFFDWCSIHASDNIYIKMNGRGKPLSAFDNFKNTLYSELNKLRKQALTNNEQDKVDFLSDFEIKMDGTWTDLFWEYRDIFTGAENYDIAPYMMNFLYYIFEFRHAARDNNFFFGGKESFKWINEKNVVTFLVLFKDLCNSTNQNKKGQITIDDYIWLSKLLDIISFRLLSKDIDKTLPFENYSDEIQLFKELSSHEGNVGSSRTIIVASIYYEYLVNASSFDSNGVLITTDLSCINQWTTLISRLIKTASIFKARYDSLLRDKHILSGIEKELIPLAFTNNASGNFLISASEFTNIKLESIRPYFDASHVYSQLVDEIEKFKLRKIDKEHWSEEISNTEKELPLFENMIYFLIKLSQVTNENTDINLFKKYSNIMTKIVNGKFITNQNKFSAIMLSYADYRISCGEGYSNSWSLCSNTSNDSFFWRHFFDIIEGNIAEKNKTKVDVLRYTLDLIDHYGDIEKAYNSIPKDINDPSWKSVIIRYPELLDKGSKHRIICPDGSNWYLIKSDGVVKQVHSNSLYDSINIELYGLYRSTNNSSKIKFECNKILISDTHYITKDSGYVIHNMGNETSFTYEEALKYLNSL